MYLPICDDKNNTYLPMYCKQYGKYIIICNYCKYLYYIICVNRYPVLNNSLWINCEMWTNPNSITYDVKYFMDKSFEKLYRFKKY